MKKRLSMLILIAMVCAIVMPVTSAIAEGEATTITFFTWCYPTTGEKWEGFLEEFNKVHPNITVDAQGHSGVEEYLQAQKVRLLSGEAIDVTSIREETIDDYVGAGYLLDIADQALLSRYTDDQKKRITFDDKVYGVPGMSGPIGVWYNVTMFDEYGLTVPKTWDEFLNVLDTFRDAGIVPMANGGRDVWPMEFDVYPFFHKLLVEDTEIFRKLDRGEVKYTDPVWVDTFEQIADFYTKDYIHPDVVSLGYGDASTLFTSGDMPMIIHGLWLSTSIEDAAPDFEVGVFPMPYPGAAGELVAPITIGNYDAIPAASANIEAALTFLDYMTSPEGAQQIQIAQTSMFVTAPILDDSVVSQYLALWKPMLTMPFVNYFYSEQYPAANSIMTKNLQEMFLGTMTAQEAAEELQLEQNKR